MRRRQLLAAAVGAIVATALAGGIAWAAIPEGGVIQGCYDSGGNLKVVSALPCPKGYTPLAWNQQGIQGIQGLQGIQGNPGTNGTNGTNGQDGEDGVSVTSESEPAGANCAEGGSKFTATDGVTYACSGQQGPSGLSGYEIVDESQLVFAGSTFTIFAPCSSGKQIIGGGTLAVGVIGAGVEVFTSFPRLISGTYGWYSLGRNDLDYNIIVVARAICAITS